MTQKNVHNIFIKFGMIKQLPNKKEWLLGAIAVLLVISFQLYIIHLLFSEQKYLIKNELRNITFESVSGWNDSWAMTPDGHIRSYTVDNVNNSVHLFIDDKQYTFQIEPTAIQSEINLNLACDMNLSHPLFLSVLDSLVESQLSKDMAEIPFVLSKVDSLGFTKEIYPEGNTSYTDMEVAGEITIGYISGEKIIIHYDLPVLEFIARCWWQLTLILLGGILLIICTIYVILQLLKQKKLREMLNTCFRQRMHDLKIPVGAAESLINELQSRYKEAFKKGNANEICDRAQEKLAMLKTDMCNILQMSVMMHEKQVAWEKIDLKNEIEELMIEQKLAHKGKKNITGTLNYSVPLSLNLSEQFIYALRNLFDNAVKYSGENVRIEVSCYSEKNALVVTVEDNGKGIAKKDLPYIFEEYWRVGNGETAKGYGLGLASVRKIVRRHGGKIYVESEVGKGSKFIIKLYNYGKKDKAFVCRGREGYSGKLCPNIVGAEL